MDLTFEIVSEWWRDRQPDGIFQSEADDAFTDSEWDRAQAVTDFLDDQAKDESSLKRLIEILVATAPRPERIPFIGTVFLEDVYPELGDRVFQVLDKAAISDAAKAAVRSGFLW